MFRAAGGAEEAVGGVGSHLPAAARGARGERDRRGATRAEGQGQGTVLHRPEDQSLNQGE